ncbi:MAG: TIGR00266 family protein [Verrucomicrobiae bacterium]|nr:TIGR00266 family protein [Verrucomicrobiae bacterium]
MKTWHYTSGGGGQAQTDEENLSELVEAGAIKPATMMWSHGMANWEPASNVLPQLFQGDGSPPPLPVGGPPPLQTIGRRSHEIDYEIIGESIQMVEIELDPGETVIAEAGAMNYMEDGISFETKMGDGSEPDQGIMGKLLSAGKRAITGESLFMTHFTNRGGGKKRVTFAAPYPGTVVPVNLAETGNELLCQKDAFLCAAMGTKVGIAFNQRLGSGLFGGEGFILQKLNGDGMAFVHAGGTVVRKELKGEKLMVDTGCLVAFTKGVNYNIERAGNLKSMLFGGEGLFLATLQGHGSVWLQSMPFARLAQRITGMYAQGKGEGSVIGGLGNLFGD